jgi:hypothetical protein
LVGETPTNDRKMNECFIYLFADSLIHPSQKAAADLPQKYDKQGV